jgi:hypothetical protein
MVFGVSSNEGAGNEGYGVFSLRRWYTERIRSDGGKSSKNLPFILQNPSTDCIIE